MECKLEQVDGNGKSESDGISVRMKDLIFCGNVTHYKRSIFQHPLRHKTMSTPPENNAFFQTILEKCSKLSFFSVSLLIHIVIVASLGSAVLVREMIPKETFVATTDTSNFLEESTEPAGPPADEPVEFDELTFSPEPSNAAPASAPSQLSALATDSVTNSSNFTVTAASAIPSMGTSMSNTAANTAMAVGAVGQASGGRGSSGGLKTGTLFGVTVTSSKMGVILDVSGSAHPHLTAALTEIDKNFSDALIYLNPGTGMRESATEKMFDIVPLRQAMRAIKAPKHDDGARQVANAMKKYPDADKYFDRLSKRDTVFLYNNVPERRDHMISGTHFIFEELMKQNVDTIYWFADFADAIDAEIAKKLERDLKRSGIKLIAHNFAGKPVRKEAEAMVKATGGTSISEIPGSVKR